MARRPPMKIAPSPSDTPEHDAVRERERSSEAVQAKLREERAAEAAAKPKKAPPVRKAAQASPEKATDTPRPKRTRPKPAQKAPAADEATIAATGANPAVVSAEPDAVAPPKRVEQRISVGVPISLATSKALEKAANKLGTDIDYIKRALIPKARAAFLERATADDLKKTSSRMTLLFEQRIDNGVELMQVKLAIDADIEKKVRAFIPDPLDVISVNRLVAAFVGAEFETLVAAL